MRITSFRRWVWTMRLRLWMIRMLWPGHTSWGICGNRIWLRSPFGLLDVTLTIRDTTIPDAYSREELLEMVQTVRRHEKIQEWKVPEPSDE